jgi:hypothetical protein
MFNIADFLGKFKNLGLNERLLKEVIKEVVKDVANLDLEVKNILVKGDEIIFKVSPAIKNVLYIKKQLILDKIKERGMKENINNFF